MTPQEVVRHFGTQTKAADALGCKQHTISGWVKTGKIPETRQFQIEVVTGGALRADRTAPPVEREAA